MKRSLVIALLLSLGVAAAQTTGPTAIPNVFTDGTKMSASAMNENLQALEDRMDVIREAVIETRREQVKLRDRVDLLTEATPSGAATGSFESAYPQQAEEPAWPFAAGDLVDANLVNRAFSDFQDAADNIDEFSRLLMKDMQTISDKISALEQLYSLPVGEGFEAELFAYVPPTAKKFKANERIVTADVNANFGQLWASLDVLEHNVEEAMAAVQHEAQRYYELEEIAGPPALAEESYLLPLQGVLDDEDFSATTEIWYAVLERITPSGPSRAWPDTNGFSLSPSGEYDFVIDARDVAYDIDPLSPQGLQTGSYPSANRSRKNAR